MGGWKEDFLSALFPLDERVIKLPYIIKGRSSNRELLNKLIPDRKKPDLKLVEQLIRENIPKMLFKYRSLDSNSYAISNFEDDTIWLSQPQSFNDPFDSLSKNDVSNLTNLYNEFEEKGLISSDNKLMLQEMCNFFVKHTQMLFYVGCLCEINDSVLMWSHYANNHRGFCIGYSGSEILESDIISKNLFPVVYSDFEELPYDDSALGLDYTCLYSVLRKSKQWEYEREWRIVYSHFRMKCPGNVQLPTAKAVYLGVNISKEDRTTISRIAKIKAIPVFHAIMNIHNATVEFKKIIE